MPSHLLIRAAMAVLALHLAAAGSASAQALEVGAWGGYTVSNEFTTQFELCNMRGCFPSASNPHYSRTAPALGLAVRVQRDERLALRGELALANRGYGPGTGPHDQRVASRYLEIPLLAELRVVSVGQARLEVAGGLAPAVLLSCRYSGRRASGEITADCSDTDPLTDQSFGPDVWYDVAWVLAPGLRFPTASGSISLELRHSRGLVDTRSDAAGHTANRATLLALGFSRRIGTRGEPRE